MHCAFRMGIMILGVALVSVVSSADAQALQAPMSFFLQAGKTGATEP